MKKMENKVLIWAIVLILAVSVIFNLGDPTGYATKTLEPSLRVLNSIVKAGSNLNIDARNVQTTQEFYILNENGHYTGQRFFSRASKCEKKCQTINREYQCGYECSLSYRISTSLLPDGKYYVQTKDKRTGTLIGNKAHFTITDSKYVGR